MGKGKRAKTLGWGKTKTKSKESQCDLLEAYQTVDSGHRCPIESERRFCVHHGKEKAAQACYGDSGGPLIMEEDCSLEDFECQTSKQACNKDGIAVYTKVSYYLPWIKKAAGSGMACPPGFMITYGSISGRGFYNKNKKDILSCAKKCTIGIRRGGHSLSCCSFEWSEREARCKLHHRCQPDQPRHRDYLTCRKEAHGCHEAYELIEGSAKGNNLQMNNVNHIKCSFQCSANRDCCSYEYSPDSKICNLHEECEAKEKKVEDLLFCRKGKKPQKQSVHSRDK